MMLRRHAITDSATAANPHPLSVNSAIKLLISTMRDPMSDTVCSTRMSIAADRINQALEACDSLSAKIKLAKSNPELLRAGIKFLTFKHSPQDFATMMNRLVQCRCDFGQKGMRRLHTPRSGCHDGLGLSADGTNLVFNAVDTVVQCIVLALFELTQHKFHAGNSSDDKQPWPQGPEDLLPFGPKDSVNALELWVTRPPNGYSIFKLAGCLAKFYAPFGAEVFQYLNYSFPLAWTFQHLNAAVIFYDEGDSSLLARKHFFEFPILTIFQFFDDLLGIDLPQFMKMVFLRGDWLKPILTSLTIFFSTLPPEYQWFQIRALMSLLTSYANAKRDPKTGLTVADLDYSLLEDTAKQVDLVEAGFNQMRSTRKLGCWNIQCPSQNEVIHSRLCGKCTLMRFCGEKCQKEAWKFHRLPHKDLCAKIYSLKEALGCADGSLLWTNDFTFAQFEVLCRTKNVDVKMVDEIGCTIGRQWLCRNAMILKLQRAEASRERQPILGEPQGEELALVRHKARN